MKIYGDETQIGEVDMSRSAGYRPPKNLYKSIPTENIKEYRIVRRFGG